MAAPRLPEPVKIFVAALWSDAASLQAALARLREEWGELDFEGGDHPFDATRYYAGEMGDSLRRRLVSFRELAPPESLVEAKLLTNEVEEALRGSRGRRVNLDVGYLDLSKVVLASGKPLGQKVHLGKGIYADLVCRYKRGRFTPFEWTFPDFRDGRYDGELLEIRSLYKKQVRGGGGEAEAE